MKLTKFTFLRGCQLLTYYQVYRNAQKYSAKSKVEEAAKKVLPTYVDYDTLSFLNEIVSNDHSFVILRIKGA